MRIIAETTFRRVIFVGMSSFALMMTMGCKSDMGGITPPLPDYYLQDGNIEYFPTGPKFKLSKEAEEMRASREAHKKVQTTPYEITNESIKK